MTRATDPLSAVASGDASAAHGYVCPFCGLTREITPDFDASVPCPRCAMSDTPTTRGATKARVGPWHVRQVRNPWAPGMRFETLLALVKRGQVTRDSIVRGPTTHQLWKLAAEVKGLSREFGVCHACGGEVDPRANLCPHCNRLQEPPVNPDILVEARDGEVHPAASRRAGTVPGSNGSAGHGEHDAARATLPGPRPKPAEPGTSDRMSVSEEQAAMARRITSRPPTAQHPSVPDTSAAPKPRPLSIRPSTPGSEDALLTPQELAAAFQLDFSPERPARRRRRRGSKLLVAAFVVLLLGGGAALLGYWRPDWRQSALAWSARTYGQVKTFIISRTAPSRPAPSVAHPRTERAVARDGKSADASRRAPAGATPKATEPVAEIAGAKQPASTAPTASPAPTTPAAESPVDVVITPTAPRAPQTGKTETPASAHVAPGSPAAPNPPAASNDPYAQAKRLWGLAIDAEANQDYAGAVNYYEQIKKLPEDVHPWGLDVRLDWARKRAK